LFFEMASLPMGSPTSHFVLTRRSKQIDGILRAIVEASLPLARNRISTETNRMSASELRGYLRARALFVVRDQAHRLFAAQQFDDLPSEELLERALERTVSLLLRELTDEPPLVLPMYEPLRRAAA
jgi:hypothetical protein